MGDFASASFLFPGLKESSMKHIPFRGLAAAAFGFMIFVAAAGNSQTGTSRQEAKRLFEALKRNALHGADGKKAYSVRSGRIGEQRLNFGDEIDVTPVPPAPDTKTEPIQLALSIYFRLEDGKYVNPQTYKWREKEPFSMWVETAVPIQLHLFQNYSDDSPKSKAVYPDEKYSETFSSIFPGKPVKLPVNFQTDPGETKEMMSLVVARTDAEQLPILEQAKKGDELVFRPALLQKLQFSMVSFNMEATRQGTIAGHSARFDIIEPGMEPVSTMPDAVQLYLLGDRKIHQFQITLQKQKSRGPGE